MTLTPGSRLGPYEIVAPLGAGGMGEVHRAIDTRLDRVVAIKALPEAYALHPERLARFEREAKLVASLNHPNIAGIHGLERLDGRVYLVLEFVEGETLADRLRRGPLPLRDALGIARQIAAAIEAAHEAGIIHRDLKPGNVMLRPDGEAKVLDFGLAKGGDGTSASDPNLSISPTMTFAATQAGVILGTAAYMSPEQARGKGVDRRTDIWSFGCVLYEMLSGRQAFEGETVSDLIARILEREPDWNGLPSATPPAIRELLQRCLEKDAKQRLRDIGDARLTLDREIATGSRSGIHAAPAPLARAGRAWTMVAAALVLGAALGAGGRAVLANRSGASGMAPMTHLTIALPEDPRIMDGDWSPDGKVFALVGVPASAAALGDDARRIYLRRTDSFELVPLAGTEGVRSLRFTPDSRWIVFRAPLASGASEDRLARIPVDGSVPPVTIVKWNPEWRSFTVLHGGGLLMLDRKGERLFRLPANGGVPKEARVERGDIRAEMELGDPLPGDHAVFIRGSVYRERGWSIEVGAIDLDHDRLVMLGQEGGNATWSPKTGHLLFSRGDVLLAAPFDPSRLALRGAPVAVASGLYAPFSYLPGEFKLGPGGTLLVVPGGAVGNQRRLGLVDRDGKLKTLDFDPQPYQTWPSPAADGHTFGVRITNAQGLDEIWAGDLGAPGLRRVASWPAADCTSLLLSGDGRYAAYARVGRDSLDGIYVVDLQSPGAGRRVVVPESAKDIWRVSTLSRDATWLVMDHAAEGGRPDLWIARLSAGRDSALDLKPLRATPWADEASDFSVDGRWLAWQSDESGRLEVYVAPFADGALGRPIRVTDQGGTIPEWLADGRHLSVHSLDFKRVRVLDLGSPPGPGPHPSRDWFDLGAIRASDSFTLPDGRAMVVLRGPKEDEGTTALNLIFGWTDGMKRRLAAAR